jgi:glycosyltransferase involved in cell wall biosynthesis
MKIFFCDQEQTSSTAPHWARLSLNLAEALGKRGHDVYAPLPKHHFPLHGWEKGIIFIKDPKELEEEFDIVQGHSSLLFVKNVIEIANKFNAQPFQWITNDLFLNWGDFCYMIRHELPIIKRTRKRFLSHLAGLGAPKSLRIPKMVPNLIVPTKYLSDELSGNGVTPDKISVIPLGINSQLFSPITEDTRNVLKTKMNLKGKVVLFFGGYNALRGIGTTIKVFEIIKRKREGVNVVFALWNAPSPFRGYINLGYRADIYNIINLADVICLPFRGTHQMTAIPLVLLEAMSCGRAIVSTNVASIPEIIDHNHDGILVNYNSDSQVAQETAEAVIELLKNDVLRKKLEKNARSKILTKYDLNNIAKSFELVYQTAQNRNLSTKGEIYE